MKKFLIKNAVYLFVLVAWMGCKENAKEDMKDKRTANDLINEQSPYLLQHAYNPVDWKPWSASVFDEAKEQNRLVIVSIGYASCHWCHVMEEESFENDSVAKVMNEHFVNIKVDREERPDVDQVYMDAAQLMTGRGGWPLNCITLSDGRPVYAGTYHTKDQWLEVLNQLQKMYKDSPEKMEDYANRLMGGLEQLNLVSLPEENTSFNSDTVKSAVDKMITQFDMQQGGDRAVQKFPMPGKISFLMRYGFQTNNQHILDFVDLSLKKMAYGGIYDQLGGGFARYSVDSLWHVPHFEKMLYDNAQLVSLYAKAYKKDPNNLYKSVIEETISFVENELTNVNEGFYSSLDADSNDDKGSLEEGAFYTWTEPQLKEILNNDFELFKDYFNINKNGLWENDQYVLRRTISDEDFNKTHGLTVDQLGELKGNWKEKLLNVRNQRPKPRLDDKVLTSWSGLMVTAYVDAYKALNDSHFKEVAIKQANFLREKVRKEDGGLYHMFKEGNASVSGYLEDYAAVIQSLLGVYEITFDASWLEEAKALSDYTIEHFQDKKTGLFYFTSNTDHQLISRKIEMYDNVIPASNSIMAKNLYYLSHYFDASEYLSISKNNTETIIQDLVNAPSGFFNWLDVIMDHVGPFYEVAVNGKDASEFSEEIFQHYLPNSLLAGSKGESQLPLLQNRFQEGKTLVYVCVNKTCKLPVDSVEKAFPLITSKFD